MSHGRNDHVVTASDAHRFAPGYAYQCRGGAWVVHLLIAAAGQNLRHSEGLV